MTKAEVCPVDNFGSMEFSYKNGDLFGVLAGCFNITY